MAHDIDLERNIILDNVERFRLEAGLTQQSLADAADLSVDTVRGYSARRRLPDRTALRALAQVFGRTLDDFYNPNPPPADPSKRIAFRFKIVGEVDPDLVAKVERFISSINMEHVQRIGEAKRAMRKGKKT